MGTGYKLPEVVLSERPTAEIDADLLVVPVFVGDDLTDESTLDAACGSELSRAQARQELTGKPYELLHASTAAAGWKTPRVLCVGAGPRASCTADTLRRVAVAGALVARQKRLTRLAVVLRADVPVSLDDAAQATAEGVTLANFDGASRATSGPAKVWLEHVEVRAGGATAGAREALARGRTLGDYTNQARALVNAPGNDLTPTRFAEEARAIAEAAGATVSVLDETTIAALNMGLLLGVTRGSQEPPRLVVARHEPREAVPGVVLGLVGKGITFDTGGISIKPAEHMDRMKDDMSGGAAVLCALAAIARLGLPVRCIAVVPMSENMPGGRAIKPGDVLTSAQGKTVEILNTDAEGRLVLGDAVWYARELGVTHLVDVATLTGSCVVALGKTTTGLFGTPAAWVEQVRLAGERAGERSWPMPVFDDYREQLKSEIADVTNSGGRAGGAITGALFIKEFAGDLPWVHADIAGTAWAEEATPYQVKGATGVMVRTLVELARQAASWGSTTPKG